MPPYIGSSGSLPYLGGCLGGCPPGGVGSPPGGKPIPGGPGGLIGCPPGGAPGGVTPGGAG